MMNKKGFTLIEVVVSIVLVSIVLVSMMATLLRLRDTYSVIHENSDVIVYSSSIARVINNDLNNNNGIRYASCSNNGKECDLILGNDDRRKLEIIKEETLVGTENDVEHSKITTTLKYTNTTVDSELLYIRTLELDKYQNTKTRVITTNGYIFYDMYANQYDYDSDSGKVQADVITRLDIRLYDGYNIDDERYNIILYASGRYDYSAIVGKTYVITLDSDEADIDGTQGIDEVFGVAFFETETNHTKDNIVSDIRKPKKGTLAFAGYYLVNPNDTLGEIIIDATGSITVSSRKFKSDALLRAKWEVCEGGYEIINDECVPRKFQVTLNQNQGKNGTSKYQATYMAKVPDIVIPKLTGYTFVGYYDIDGAGNIGSKQYHDEEGLGQVIYDTIGDITLKAKWTPNHYRIAYDMNDGENPIGNPTAGEYDKDVIIEDASKVGYTFDGWTGKNNLDTSTAKYGVSTADTPWTNANDKVKSKTRFANLTPKDGREVTLEAHFTANQYTVSYETNGGTACNPSTKKVTFDSQYSTLCTTTKTGYTFAGWHLDSTLTNKVTNTTIVKTASDHTLYAKWTANTYSISYTLNSGTHGTNHPETGTYDSAFTINNPTRSGYTFKGWNITGMQDGITHTYGSSTSTGTSLNYITATSFKNLRATDGTVAFTAGWCQNCASVSNGTCTLTIDSDGNCNYATSCNSGYHYSSGQNTRSPVCEQDATTYYGCVNNPIVCCNGNCACVAATSTAQYMENPAYYGMVCTSGWRCCP